MTNFSVEEIGKCFMAVATVKLCKNIVYRHFLCHGDEIQRKKNRVDKDIKVTKNIFKGR